VLRRPYAPEGGGWQTERTSEHDPVRGRIDISSRFENASFTPRNRQGPRREAPADAEVAVVEDLRLDAPLAVIPQLARPGVVVLSELFAGNRRAA
jgi:hypothetical protein